MGNDDYNPPDTFPMNVGEIERIADILPDGKRWRFMGKKYYYEPIQGIGITVGGFRKRKFIKNPDHVPDEFREAHFVEMTIMVEGTSLMTESKLLCESSLCGFKIPAAEIGPEIINLKPLRSHITEAINSILLKFLNNWVRFHEPP